MLRRFLFFLFVLIFAAVNGADARLLLHLDGSVTEGKPREVAFKDMAGDFDALPMASNDPNETGVGVVLGMDQTPFGAVGNTAISIGYDIRTGIL
jgi:hypothetical protein